MAELKKPLSVHIVSDGTSAGTHVKDVETGEKIGMIQEITWHISVNEPPKAVIVVALPSIDIKTDVEIVGGRT